MQMSYLLIKQYDNQHTHIKFAGSFQDHAVTWDTHFYTLNGYNSQESIENKSLKQFLYIEPGDTDVFKLTIVLKIPEITEPNIHKMMIMIKQYKNLSLGRHEYG